MRAHDEFLSALRLSADGLSDGEVARRLAIPRRTVNGWRRCGRTRRGPQPPDGDWRPTDRRSYAYVLGLYLGDGHIAHAHKAPFLRICLDAKYPAIVDEARRSVSSVFSEANVLLLSYRPEVRIIQVSERALPAAFPQHGLGPKHRRPITLHGWQERITAEHPCALLRGLIHSDGSRCLNRFQTELPRGRVAAYEYPRYFFTNMSADIRDIFCVHCALLGIRCTQSNFKNLSVSDRNSVALLDTFIGPKR